MNKNCAFTICTKSYLGLAETLKDSFLRYNESFDFYIIFCDGELNEQKGVVSGKKVVGLGDDKYDELAFKYNVTEFCTCIKPFGFTYFFDKKYVTVAYFDPDIMFFSRFNELYEDYSVFLTPHILNVKSKVKNDWGQEAFLKYGVYNCGFVGLKNDECGKFVAEWWGGQVLTKSFAEPLEGMYTDQKWMDMVPSFIDLSRINVIKNYGCDFAPWNYSERTVEKYENQFFAVSRDEPRIMNKVVFVHYSAYNYKKLISNGTVESKYNLTHYPEIDVLINEYKDALNKHNTLNSFSVKYKYNEYDNGLPILSFHRRLYRACIEDGFIINNPFSCGKHSFFEALKKAKLISKSTPSDSGKNGIKGFEAKNKQINKLYKIVKRILGVDNYILFLRKTGNMAQFENNTFLMSDTLRLYNCEEN